MQTTLPPLPALAIGTLRNSYEAQLPDRMYARGPLRPVRAPRLLALNTALAQELGLDVAALRSDPGVAVLAGNAVPLGPAPMALGYAGHQFGNFVPQLGDGRALLLGEAQARDGRWFDLQLKGSGPTAYSRRGDGRAALGPVLREYIVSEAMTALGVPSTRALAAVETGEPVQREEPLPGAVLLRVAASHLRVGTFQLAAARGDTESLHALVAYALERHYPELAGTERPAAALLAGVVERQAELVARWMGLGFIHGVMNTDNTSISGETIDFGPCAFMEAFDPRQVFSSIDHAGRYAYSNQPHAMHWNLARLAEALLPLLAAEAGGVAAEPEAGLPAAHEALARFAPRYEAALLAGWRRKLGLLTAADDDAALADDLLACMHAGHADFTLCFRRLGAAAAGDEAAMDAVRALFHAPASTEPSASINAWLDKWTSRLAREGGEVATRRALMDSANPARIPRNHQVQRVIDAAVADGEYAPFDDLLAATAHPYTDDDRYSRYEQPAEPHERVTATFCGT